VTATSDTVTATRATDSNVATTLWPRCFGGGAAAATVGGGGAGEVHSSGWGSAVRSAAPMLRLTAAGTVARSVIGGDAVGILLLEPGRGMAMARRSRGRSRRLCISSAGEEDGEDRMSRGRAWWCRAPQMSNASYGLVFSVDVLPVAAMLRQQHCETTALLQTLKSAKTRLNRNGEIRCRASLGSPVDRQARVGGARKI
jgi:hypothetical protein